MTVTNVELSLATLFVVFAQQQQQQRLKNMSAAKFMALKKLLFQT